MDLISTLAQIGALLAAVGVALFLDRATVRRGLTPPGFANPVRRTLAAGLVAALFYFAVFLPITAVGRTDPAEIVEQPIPLLFTMQVLLASVVGIWYLLGFAARAPADPARRFSVQFGLVAARPLEELGLGLVAGGVAWLGLIAVMLAVVGAFVLFGGEDALPQQAPEVIAWIAALPVAVRVALSLAAGFVEELFFRGFLQPRAGIALSTGLFVLAHSSYEQPFMLVGLTFLSLVLALVVRWRQNIWPAIVAHAAFDLFQLLVIIPTVLDLVPSGGAGE